MICNCDEIGFNIFEPTSYSKILCKTSFTRRYTKNLLMKYCLLTTLSRTLYLTYRKTELILVNSFQISLLIWAELQIRPRSLFLTIYMVAALLHSVLALSRTDSRNKYECICVCVQQVYLLSRSKLFTLPNFLQCSTNYTQYICLRLSPFYIYICVCIYIYGEKQGDTYIFISTYKHI